MRSIRTESIMAKIHPFKAVRPTRDKAHLVATRPLTSYKKHILKAKLEENPFTFLHIIHPEVDKGTKTKPNSVERFAAVRSRFDDFVEEGILKQDAHPAMYVYQQSNSERVFTGVIAGASIAEYEQDTIKKHEATLTSREEMFTNYLELVGFNAEPVLMSHEPSEDIDTFLKDVTKKRPELEFSTTDRVKHELWILSPTETDEIQSYFNAIPALYIADGHHRSASSVRLAQKMRDKKGNFVNPEFFLAFLMDERKLHILEYNRLVNSLNGMSEETFLNKLKECFTVSPLKSARNPLAEHEITCCIKGNWYSLTIDKSKVDNSHPVHSLDAQLLTDLVLTPILGISDLKTDKNIQFMSGAEGIEGIENCIEKELAEVGFVLYPVRMDQVKRVADHQMIMPPKSTWVEPKIRSGLTIYMIEE